MILEYFAYLFVGRLLMYLLRLFPPVVRLAEKYEDTEKLLNCDLCLGVWTYTILSGIMNIQIMTDMNIFGYLLTGSVSSFIMALIVDGWNQKFREYVIK